MKLRIVVAALAAALISSVVAGAAWARNPHCAGGIQYLTQALSDKQRGNTEDYHREISKAVQQLEACSGEDPADFEAAGYLGWAYGEVDSMAAAGKAFQIAIDGLQAKGDKKKLELVQNNRESFWATAFNKGIASINTAQTLWNPFTNEASTDTDKKAKADAQRNYEEALASLNRALSLKPSDPRTLRNLGAIHAFMGDYAQAEELFKEGLKYAPNDSDIVASVKQARQGRAAQLVKEKKFDEAMHYYQDLLKDEPNNGDLWAGLGDAALEQAKTLDGDAKKAAFTTAGDAYAKAATLAGGSYELSYNSAICYQNAGNQAACEAQWRAALSIKKDDREVMLLLSSVLSEEKKTPEAIALAMKAIALDPKDKGGFRQLGYIYSKANDSRNASMAVYAYLALKDGKPADAPTSVSGADGAKIAATMGKPESILLWEAESQKYETWFYDSKGQAYHFTGGAQQGKTDWSAALAAK